MLHYLQKGSPEVRNFLRNIFLISLSFHLFILFFALFVSFQEPFKFDIKSKNKFMMPLVLMPFTKTVKGSLSSLKSRSNKINSANIVKKSKITVYKNQPKKSQKSKTQINNKNEVNKLKKEAKIEQEKLIKKIQETKIVNKQAESDLQLTKDLEQLKIAQDSLAEPVFVGRQDLEQLGIIEFVENEINSYWRPPVGMPKNLECSARMFVDKDGKVTNFKIEKPSKSLVFDMSIKRDISKITMPKELYLREVCLTFTPPQE